MGGGLVYGREISEPIEESVTLGLPHHLDEIWTRYNRWLATASVPTQLEAQGYRWLRLSVAETTPNTAALHVTSRFEICSSHQVTSGLPGSTSANFHSTVAPAALRSVTARVGGDGGVEQIASASSSCLRGSKMEVFARSPRVPWKTDPTSKG